MPLIAPAPTTAPRHSAQTRGVARPVNLRIDPAGAMIGEHTARFRDPLFRDRPLPPFPAYLQQPTAIGPVPADFAVRPRFGVQTLSRGREHIVEIALEPGTHLYGTGEVAGPLLRNGRRTWTWNTDSFAYSDSTRSLYQSHPFVLAVRPDGSAFGVICETTWRTRIDTGRSIRFVTEGPSPAVVVIERSSAIEVVRALAELTGFMPLPPKWALGFQQCRWSYEPDERVRALARDFREKRVPCDVIWMDIDYMDGFRCFTFDGKKFGNPVKLNADLHELGFKAVYMIDPGLKHEPATKEHPGYGIYTAGHERDLFIKDAQGQEFHGEVWPGMCAFPDFTSAKVRTWWAALYKEFMATGIDGIWNDMNEPAVFKGWDKSMPQDNQHRADADLGGPGPHAQYHNIYGMQMVRASREGIQAANPDKRPFVLTRANFLGGQRYAATWTGDNVSNWSHFSWSIPMVLNLGLSGQPFAGPDIGGFAENAQPEMFGRWMGLGALFPFSRAHSVKDSFDHEPWSFGDTTLIACRRALERRYRLMPYLYTCFREAAKRGEPVARPAFFADARDVRLRGADECFLLGPDVYVRATHDPLDPTPRAPVPQGASGRWRSFDPSPTPAGERDPLLPELLIRPGAIVPLGPVTQWVDQQPLTDLTLLINLDANGQASGKLYEDAGDGYGYKQGAYRLTTWKAHREPGTDRVAITVTDVEGDYTPPGLSERSTTVLVLTQE
ncbi:MAG: glycoside hydrolase family 31 protein [Planctomycetota bacterium]|nr:glycoside hydrolase family 31 protein [Planctomycetota bacterium]